MTHAAEQGGIPAALAIGRCVEVWTDETAGYDPRDVRVLGSTRIRFSAARAAFLAAQGITDPDGFQVIPSGRPWSVSEDVGAHRLARSGLSLDDLPALREQADHLYAADERGHDAMTRAYRRSKTGAHDDVDL